MTDPFPTPMIDMDDLARLLKVSREWVRKRVQAGEFPCHRPGGAKLIRFDAEDVEAIFAMGAQPVVNTQTRSAA